MGRQECQTFCTGFSPSAIPTSFPTLGPHCPSLSCSVPKDAKDAKGWVSPGCPASWGFSQWEAAAEILRLEECFSPLPDCFDATPLAVSPSLHSISSQPFLIISVPNGLQELSTLLSQPYRYNGLLLNFYWHLVPHQPLSCSNLSHNFDGGRVSMEVSSSEPCEMNSVAGPWLKYITLKSDFLS